jgi:hypothetical protein
MSDTEKDQERGEKRGVLSTGRASKLGKTKDADTDADAANDSEGEPTDEDEE